MIKNESKLNRTLFTAIINCIFLIFSLLFFNECRNLLPSYFYNDNLVIRTYMQNNYLNTDRSFANTAKFFTALNFNYDTSYFMESFFSWIVFLALYLIMVIKYKIDFSKYNNLILLFMFSIFYGAYAAQFSKELVVFILMDFVLLISTSKSLKYNLLIFILIYGIFFRTYWILIFVLSILFYFVARNKHTNLWSWIACYFLIIICMELSYNFVTGNFLSNYRYSVNVWRAMDVNSNTIINNPLINSNILTDFLNFLYGLLNIFIPINGINSSNEIIYYLWIWIIVWITFRSILKNKDDLMDYKLYFLIGMISVQAFFEPDIGSMLRHQIVLLPILLLFSNRDTFLKSNFERSKPN